MARPMRRVLLVPTPRRASLAPVYLSLLLLACASLLGLLVAAWPREPGPGPSQPHVPSATAGQSFEGRLFAPAEARGSRRPGTWM